MGGAGRDGVVRGGRRGKGGRGLAGGRVRNCGGGGGGEGGGTSRHVTGGYRHVPPTC